MPWKESRKLGRGGNTSAATGIEAVRTTAVNCDST